MAGLAQRHDAKNKYDTMTHLFFTLIVLRILSQAVIYDTSVLLSVTIQIRHDDAFDFRRSLFVQRSRVFESVWRTRGILAQLARAVNSDKRQ